MNQNDDDDHSMYGKDPNRAHLYVDIVECAKRGWTHRVQHYINQGNNFNEKDSDGDCAFIWAARNDDLNMMKMLVNAGASLNVKEASGLSPFGYAVANQNQAMKDYITEQRSKEKQ